MCGREDSLLLTQYVCYSRQFNADKNVSFSREFNAEKYLFYIRMFNAATICAVNQAV
jgi:hypothetical protein